MPVRAIDHVQLAMPAGQEDRARRFYQGVLGLPERAKPPELARRGGVWFETGAVKIHLGVDLDFRPARKAHPALVVDGLDEIVRRCRDEGHRVVDDEPLPGNRLELMEPA